VASTIWSHVLKRNARRRHWLWGGITEFTAFTNDNKFVHVAGAGWVALSRAYAMPDTGAPYRLGFQGLGPAVADLPVIVAVSAHAERLVAMTWGKHTVSLVGNPRHPCIHADPGFPDLAPGERAAIQGEILFFEGKLEAFDVSIDDMRKHAQ